MTFDFSSIFFILIAIMALQPLLMGRWYAIRRAQAIRAIEKEHGTRVITMIHRQERRSLFGFAVSRHIDLEDAQTVIAAIKDTPDDTPIDLIIHTPGGIVLAAMQIARAVEAHPRKLPPMFQSMRCQVERSLRSPRMKSSWVSSLSLARSIHKSSGFQLQVSLERATRNPWLTFLTSRLFWLMSARRLSLRLSEGQ